MENRKGRRNSILKTNRTTVDVLSETVDNGVAGGPVTNRRVSFHNTKQIQEYDRHHGQMIEGTPIKEKIADTLGSDGILTPRGGNMDNTNVLEHDGTFQVFNAHKEDHGAADMSLETTVGGGGGANETARLFDVTRDKTVYYEKVVETTKTTKITKIYGGVGADDTMALFNQTNTEEVDMSVDQKNHEDTMAIFNQTNPEEQDMELDQSTFAVPRVPGGIRGKAQNMTMNKTLNQSIPMDLEEEVKQEEKKGNETLNMFNVTNPDQTDMDISHHQPQFKSANDTLALFRSPASSRAAKQVFPVETTANTDMDITGDQVQEPEEPGSEAMDISQAPPTPRGNKNATLAIFQQEQQHVDDDMDITQNTTIKTEKAENKPMEESRMDISNSTLLGEPQHVEVVKEQSHMDISSSTVVDAHSETMAMFQASPARAKLTSANVTTTPDANDTLKMFQSPARSGIEGLKMPISAQKTKIFDDDSMDIEESTLHHPESPTPAPEDPKEPEDAPEDPETPEATLQYPKEPADQSVLEEDRAGAPNDSVLVPGDDMDVSEEAELQKTFQKDMSISRDQSEGHMDISMEQSSQKPRPLSSAQDVSTINNDSIILNVSGKAQNESMMLKTMQISAADVTNTLGDEEETGQRTVQDRSVLEQTFKDDDMEMEEEETLKEKDATIPTPQDQQEQLQLHEHIESSTIVDNITTTSVLDLSCSIIRNTSRRRRSHLRDASVRESPRRMALENSMHISMQMPSRGNDGMMTALAEYRQNKSGINESELNESQNVSVASNGGGAARDIFALSTALRSPKNLPSKSINLNSPRPPSPIAMDSAIPSPPSPGFQLPTYDPSVVNVVYLSTEEGATYSEAQDFQKLVQKEKEALMEFNENLGALGAKISKNDEREVMEIAREEAEIQFLELRLKFAAEQHQKQLEEIQAMEAANSKIADTLRDAQMMPQLKRELAVMRTQYTKSEAREIRQEYMKWKKQCFDAQMAALKLNYDLACKIGNQRAELRMEMEEFDERCARIEEEKKRECAAIVEELVKIVSI